MPCAKLTPDHLEQARKIAKKSHLRTNKHGAILIYRGKVVGRGFNTLKFHAEENLLRGGVHPYAAGKLDECTMLVVRVTKTGLFTFSKPCMRCEPTICRHGVGWVLYTTYKDVEAALGEPISSAM